VVSESDTKTVVSRFGLNMCYKHQSGSSFDVVGPPRGPRWYWHQFQFNVANALHRLFMAVLAFARKRVARNANVEQRAVFRKVSVETMHRRVSASV